MTEAEFVKIAGREPTEMERRVNGFFGFDLAQPGTDRSVRRCARCGIDLDFYGCFCNDSDGGECD